MGQRWASWGVTTTTTTTTTTVTTTTRILNISTPSTSWASPQPAGDPLKTDWRASTHSPSPRASLPGTPGSGRWGAPGWRGSSGRGTQTGATSGSWRIPSGRAAGVGWAPSSIWIKFHTNHPHSSGATAPGSVGQSTASTPSTQRGHRWDTCTVMYRELYCTVQYTVQCDTWASDLDTLFYEFQGNYGISSVGKSILKIFPVIHGVVLISGRIFLPAEISTISLRFPHRDITRLGHSATRNIYQH